MSNQPNVNKTNNNQTQNNQNQNKQSKNKLLFMGLFLLGVLLALYFLSKDTNQTLGDVQREIGEQQITEQDENTTDDIDIESSNVIEDVENTNDLEDSNLQETEGTIGQDETNLQEDKESDTQEESNTLEDAIEDGSDANQVELHFRNQNLLNDHYTKHGVEMGFDSPEAYEAAAAAVVNNPEALHKTEAEDGDDVYYIEATNEFVIVSTDGYIRTYFYPSGGISYYNRQ